MDDFAALLQNFMDSSYQHTFTLSNGQSFQAKIVSVPKGYAQIDKGGGGRTFVHSPESPSSNPGEMRRSAQRR